MEERLGFVVPTNPSVFSVLLSTAKSGSTNKPSECAGSLNNVVYDGCNG